MNGARLWCWGLALSMPLLLGVTCGFQDMDVEERTLTAPLEGAQVVPPVETAASGTATARLWGNNLAIQGTFQDLGSPVLQEADFPILLRFGEPGANGVELLAIAASSLDGRTGTFQTSRLIDDSLVEAFLAGETYVEIRTVDHPEGELRGQLQ